MFYFFQAILFAFPWPIRSLALRVIFKFKISSTAKIGYSLIRAKRVELGPNCRIGHFSIAKGLDELRLVNHSTIGSFNWITAFPTGTNSKHFSDSNRLPCLIVGEHSAITSRHLIDCTDSVTLGRFSTFAGFRSQILTHSIKLSEARQRCSPISIGDYCFVGTGAIILPGSSLPNYSVLAAGSVLTRKLSKEFSLYSGSPAEFARDLPDTHLYFSREKGFVV